MKIIKTVHGNELEIALVGELDSGTAPDLERELEHGMEGIQSLTLNLKKLKYMSSAGLRLMLIAHNTFKDKGGLKITHANEDIQNLFDEIGYSEFLKTEQEDDVV